jgi:hypothetical protein
MVAPEPGEPLLLYIVATAKVLSMVLVAERPEPHPKCRRGLCERFRVPGPGAHGGGSQVPMGHNAVGSQLPKAISGPDNQEAIGSQLPEAVLDPGGQEPLGPKAMEVDALDPPPLAREGSELLTPSVLH